MKSIMILKGLSNYDVLRNFADELGKAFESFGIKVYYIDVTSENYRNSFIEAIFAGSKHIVSFNSVGIEIKYENESIYNYFGINFIGILVDHPIYHTDRLNYKLNNKIITYVDKEHLNFLSDYIDDNTYTVFLPHGGFEKNKCNEINKNQKKIDVLFAGGYESKDEIYNSWDKYGTEIKNILSNIAEDLLSNEDIPIYNIFKKKFGKVNISELDIYKPMMVVIDKYVRAVRREECIKVLLNNYIPVTVYGDNWDNLKLKNKINLKINKPVSFSYINYLVSKSKISLNIVPSFTDGAHERVFTSMLNGAICVTDYSKYLGENFEDNKDLLFYKWNELDKLPNKISNALINFDDSTIIENAYKKAKEHHTWKNRAASLLDAINQYESKNKQI